MNGTYESQAKMDDEWNLKHQDLMNEHQAELELRQEESGRRYQNLAVNHKDEMLELQKESDERHREPEEKHQGELQLLRTEIEKVRQVLSAQHIAELEAKDRERQTERDVSNANLDIMERRLEGALSKGRERVAEILQLKKDRDVMKPLLDVGVAVRLRYLGNYKKANYYGAGTEELNQKRIEDGNAAAHNGNGSADLSLASLG